MRSNSVKCDFTFSLSSLRKQYIQIFDLYIFLDVMVTKLAFQQAYLTTTALAKD